MEYDVVYEMVTRLLGDIAPYGGTYEDKQRLHNLKQYLWLIDELLEDVLDITYHRNRRVASIVQLVNEVDFWLGELKEKLEDY